MYSMLLDCFVITLELLPVETPLLGNSFPKEVFTTDAANDELKVARMLQGVNRDDKFFPHMTCRVRDRCHAAARQLRPRADSLPLNNWSL